MLKFTVCGLLALAALAAARPGDKYSDKYDTLDLDEILAERRLLVPYMHCVLDMPTPETVRCTPKGLELKAHMREALETYCKKCTKNQQIGTRQVIGHLINHEPVFWSQLNDLYDPKRKYASKYEAELIDKYDTLDLDEILAERRLLVPYMHCVLDMPTPETVRCTPKGLELKAHMREALETYCEKCTKKQQIGTRQVIGHLINHEPVFWSQLNDLYDPQRRFAATYEKELRTIKA